MKYNIQMNVKSNITRFNKGIATLLLISQLLTSCGGFKETIVPSRPSPEPIHEAYEEPIQTYDSHIGFESNAIDEPFAFHTTTIEGTELTFTHTPSLPSPSLRGALPLPSLRGAEGDEANHDALLRMDCFAPLAMTEGKTSLRGALPLPSLRGAVGDEANHGALLRMDCCAPLAMTEGKTSLRGATGDEANQTLCTIAFYAQATHGLLRSARNDGRDALPHAHSGLQATYLTKGSKNQPTPITQYPLIPTTNGISKPFSQLNPEEAQLLAKEGKWEVSAEGALQYLGMRGRGGMQKIR